MVKKINCLPDKFQNEIVSVYCEMLQKKRISLVMKRMFDFIVSLLMLIILSPIIFIIGVLIRIDSNGSVVFKQERITKYGKIFYIYKFRTMYIGSDKGSQVTLKNDDRVTKVGRILRKYRLDELLQLINILKGEMSFVGTRPEVKKYVDEYTPEMYATLLLPAGVTSLASIKYKDEERLLASSENADDIYINEILKQKMKYNLEYIRGFSFFGDIKLMFLTVVAVLKKDEYVEKEAEEEVLERV